jgi:hypothetical protein
VAHKISYLFYDAPNYCAGPRINAMRLLPDLVRELNEQKRPIGFVLIDGDHKGKEVRRDIEALLELQPQQQVVFILHDSFNPGCREGMRTANWAKSPFVSHVELDFIPGVYHYDAHDTAEPRSMWGGFAWAVLCSEKRVGNLVIQESQRGLYEAVKRDSRHRFDETESEAALGTSPREISGTV